MEETTKSIIKKVALGILILFIFITLLNSFKTIPTGYVGIKTRFGEVQSSMLSEGINFKLPYIE